MADEEHVPQDAPEADEEAPIAYDEIIAPTPEAEPEPEPVIRGYEQSLETASAAITDAPEVDWNEMLQSCTRVLKNYQGFADLHRVVEHSTRLDGYRLELLRVIQLNEVVKEQGEAKLAAFESEMAHRRQALHDQLVSEQKRTTDEINELAARRELAQAEAKREIAACDARVEAAEQRAKDEEARIDASIGDMKKTEAAFKRRMQNMRGQIEAFTAEVPS